MATIAASDFQPSATTTRALPTADRIGALDFVRGAALFGILMMNITGFGLAHAYENPVNNGGYEGANLWSWIIIQLGFEGTQRALFSVLFGAGIVLLTSRMEGSGRAENGDVFFRRNLWLIALGMINAWVLLWYGDILYAYGVIALFAYAFRRMAAKWLLVVGLVAPLLPAALTARETYTAIEKHRAAEAALVVKASGAPRTPQQTKAIEKWEGVVAEVTPPKEVIQAEIKARGSGYLSAWPSIAPDIVWMQSYFLYRTFGDIFGMMLLGMALFKLGVLTLDVRPRVYWTMVVCGYAVGLTVNMAEVRWILDHQFGALAFKQAAISYDVGRLAMMTGHLGLLLLFYRSGIAPIFRHALSTVGQMALTNYLTHSLVCMIFFIGFGWFGQLQRHQLYYVVFTIWAVQLVISPIWLKHFQFGPVEWLWRYLTYMQRPPFRRLATA